MSLQTFKNLIPIAPILQVIVLTPGHLTQVSRLTGLASLELENVCPESAMKARTVCVCCCDTDGLSSWRIFSKKVRFKKKSNMKDFSEIIGIIKICR